MAIREITRKRSYSLNWDDFGLISQPMCQPCVGQRPRRMVIGWRDQRSSLTPETIAEILQSQHPDPA